MVFLAFSGEPNALYKTSALAIQPTLEFLPNPHRGNLPPLVLDSDNATLSTLAESKYIISSNLSSACRSLYDTISHMNLDGEVEMMNFQLSDAIRYSLNTVGCTLHEILKAKQSKNEFGNYKEAYLRITLGQNTSNSPGMPYVLEIWPSGHLSPIHNHGYASAVIKVLHGNIHAKIFNEINTLPSSPDPLLELDLDEGQVTWMSRNWYQTHQLQNLSNDYCATLQCYQYESEDVDHWPHFDYKSSMGTVAEFLPNTDITYSIMKEKVCEEYKFHLNAQKQINSKLCIVL